MYVENSNRASFDLLLLGQNSNVFPQWSKNESCFDQKRDLFESVE